MFMLLRPGFVWSLLKRSQLHLKAHGHLQAALEVRQAQNIKPKTCDEASGTMLNWDHADPEL